MNSISLLIGWILDLLFGDPPRLPHPVVLFGRLISYGERKLNHGAWRRLKGGLLAISLILITVAATWALLAVAKEAGTIVALAVEAVMVFYCLAGTTLAKEVRDVFLALDRSLDDGRRQVARIVGRDTSELSHEEVRKAALETLAENLSDGVVAPLFWFAVGGLPAMMGYKMINTLDSMIAYHSPRYLRFGTVAAHIDDVANYVPARLTALLMILAARRPRLLSFVLTYGPRHASPNSGWPEAALAGILGCRFGGPHKYFGETFYKPYIGENDRPLSTADMMAAVAINRRVEILSVVLIVITQLYCFLFFDL